MNVRCFILCFSSIVWCTAVQAQTVDRDSQHATIFGQRVEPFLKQYCVACHNPDDFESGVRVDHLDSEFSDQQLKLWEAIARQITKRAMPPNDEPQPSSEEIDAVVRWIEGGLSMAKTRPRPKNGGARRLTADQYRNTLRELLLLEENVASTLPPDAVSRDGFINNQETLELSPLLMESYLMIADQALDRCLVDPAVPPTIQHFRVELGTAINPEPCPDPLILGANSLLLDNPDFLVTEPLLTKTFAFNAFRMRTHYRFIEGYQGNDTVRDWREYNSIYHSVFACMRGWEGYPKGRAYTMTSAGLLLRPAIPSPEIFGVDNTYGPRANFKISLRELPDYGRFRVTVEAAKFDDAWLLDGPPAPLDILATDSDAVVVDNPSQAFEMQIPAAGLYRVEVYLQQQPAEPREIHLLLGSVPIDLQLSRPQVAILDLASGPLQVSANYRGAELISRIALVPIATESDAGQQFLSFQRRAPWLGVHVGLRRDCGSTLNRVADALPVTDTAVTKYMFEGSIRDFPSPDVEPDNVNYLAGIREIGVRSEYIDDQDRPRMLLRAINFEGPFYETWPPPTHRNIFIASEHAPESDAYAAEIIRLFAERAFRRPVTAEELAALQQVYDSAQMSGATFQQSIKDALVVILTSPQFLYLIETSQTSEAEPLDDYELAAKLSYFLWNGPPDESLLHCAHQARLTADLDSQVERMLADSRVGQFVHAFTSQWLSLDKFDVLEPNRDRFPDLSPHAREHLRKQPEEFLYYLLRENLSTSKLVSSEFAIVNDVVADYQRLDVEIASGFKFSRVPLADARLGGLFGQPAIMAGLSDGREPNPVKRGAWFARRIIAEPPDDPPPNVPALAESTEHLPLRERLRRHREQPGCVQCHLRIDPWGIPFEEYDAAGRPFADAVDPASQLPDGTEVSGMAELRSYLLTERSEQIAYSFMKHLATYAVGRTLTYNELEWCRQACQRHAPTGYRAGDLLLEVVHSPMFLEK